MADARGVTVKPASKEELESFIQQNKRWLPDEAEAILRAMSPIDQRRVIGAGTMSSVRDPAAVIQARVRKAREMEASIGRGPGAGAGGAEGSRISKPATKEELEAFIRGNERWLKGEAEDILRGMSPVDQKRVISAGTMSGCRDPVAVIQTRAKKARETEMELENLTAGRAVQDAMPEPQMPPPPSFCEAAAAMHMFAMPEEVSQEESRFAPAIEPKKAIEMPLMGDERGIGGVVEVLKAKYGCGKGQRLRVIGETGTLLQFEGGKTAPKNHEDKGWKWVMRIEEEAKLAAERAAEEAQLAEERRQREKKAAEEAAKAAAAAAAALAARKGAEALEAARRRQRSRSSNRRKAAEKAPSPAKEPEAVAAKGKAAGETAKRRPSRSPSKGAKSSSSSASPPRSKAKQKKAARSSSSSSSSSAARRKATKKNGQAEKPPQVSKAEAPKAAAEVTKRKRKSRSASKKKRKASSSSSSSASPARGKVRKKAAKSSSSSSSSSSAARAKAAKNGAKAR
mmetsp:Transcript_35221/g.76934  ORF Transcript_35221/g.76934 Transcript_35221/m.76934 type:complete len:512 (+) Transcript_35221:81-1616(+)